MQSILLLADWWDWSGSVALDLTVQPMKNSWCAEPEGIRHSVTEFGFARDWKRNHASGFGQHFKLDYWLYQLLNCLTEAWSWNSSP